jgi:S1-C subfamily serine protease
MVLKNKNNSTDLVKVEKNSPVAFMDGEFVTVSQEEQTKLGITGGVKVLKLNGGKLRNAGIREGFIITSIANKEIKTTEDLVDAMQNKNGGILIEGVYTNGMRAYYGFGL